MPVTTDPDQQAFQEKVFQVEQFRAGHCRASVLGDRWFSPMTVLWQVSKALDNFFFLNWQIFYMHVATD